MTFCEDKSIAYGAHIEKKLSVASPTRLLRMSRTARRAETAAGSRKDPRAGAAWRWLACSAAADSAVADSGEGTAALITGFS
ncbi:MAG: hypothetical protein L6V84_02075 [Oscillospiraceae bacterium]|nr:MAG: hypothetical protein L6V84_02075 [Oscillospiraceae bacterium]